MTTNTAALTGITPLAPLTGADLERWADESFASTFNSLKRDAWGNSTTRRDRKARLLAWQGGLCVKCGNAIADDGELSHHIAATAHGAPNKAHAGVFYGNVSVWHGTCNYDLGDRNVRFEDLARPDLVFTGNTNDLPKV